MSVSAAAFLEALELTVCEEDDEEFFNNLGFKAIAIDNIINSAVKDPKKAIPVGNLTATQIAAVKKFNATDTTVNIML